MLNKTVTSFLLLITLFSYFSLCKESEEGKIFVDGKEMSNAMTVSMFAKAMDVENIDYLGNTIVGTLELIGQISFKNRQITFDNYFKNKKAFNIAYKTANGTDEASITFVDCSIFKIEQNKGYITYRFKAKDIQ